MKVRVSSYALHVKGGREKAAVLAIPEPGKVRDVLRHLGLLGRKDIITMVNHEDRNMDYLLTEGDEVRVFPALLGG